VMNDNGVVMMMPMMVMMIDDDHRRVRGRSKRYRQSETGQSSKSKNELSHLDSPELFSVAENNSRGQEAFRIEF
jgi:hypothetical protein